MGLLDPTPRRSPTELEIAKDLIAEGRIFCESNTLDGHKATRICRDGGYYCDEHDRLPTKWRHASGAEVPGSPRAYDPPIKENVAYKANGEPADICAGFAAHKAKLERQMTDSSR